MYFDTKSYLKSNRKYTVKHSLKKPQNYLVVEKNTRYPGEPTINAVIKILVP
jgi:hypothetical protein